MKILLSKSLLLLKSSKILCNQFRTSYNFSENLKENEKRFIELNKNYQQYKEMHRFDIHKPYKKSNYFITDSQKKKQKDELITAFNNYLKNYGKFDFLEENKFMDLLSKVSFTYDNEFILKDDKFINLIIKTSEKLNKFSNYNNVILFMSFCSFQKINIKEIWNIFESFLLNNSTDFSFATRILILCSYTEENSSCIKIDFLKKFNLL